jgi:hypothetical protein
MAQTGSGNPGRVYRQSSITGEAIATRFTDASNYYCMTVRSSNTLSLRKVTNGAVTVLGTVPLTVSANTSYALRLEAVGNQLRDYVNGRLLLEAVDTTHARGMGGVAMYENSADFLDYRDYQPWSGGSLPGPRRRGSPPPARSSR